MNLYTDDASAFNRLSTYSNKPSHRPHAFDKEYYVVDLAFYHRILKCHILVELKMDTYTPDYLAQLNKCVGYFSEEVKGQDDKQPIGILLCAHDGKRVVEYALNGMLEKHFESNYLGKLPPKEQLIAFIKEK